jgi:hypothetical protein
MELTSFVVLTAILLVSFAINIIQYISFSKNVKEFSEITLIFKEQEILLKNQLETAKTAHKTSQNLSIDAQQILHDMTAHGESIVRIIPISPTDVFWRKPT